MKKWETREWWKSRQWSEEDIEEMTKEEMARLEKLPWFEHGKPCKMDIFQHRDWQEEFELTWGKWGCHGIGKLRKAAISIPTEYEFNPVFEKEPAYYRSGLIVSRPEYNKDFSKDLDQYQKFMEDYKKILEGEGVEVYELEPPESPIGPYGFMKAFPACGLTITKAGFIANRAACAGYLSWLWGHFSFKMMEIGCPTFYMLQGDEIGEFTPIYIGENSAVIQQGFPSNAAGTAKYKSLLEQLGDEVWVAHMPGFVNLFDFPAGGTSHVDMALGCADLGLCIVYPSFLDYTTIGYLRSKGIRFIEVPPDEWHTDACNIVPLGPGKVVIPAEAKQTIAALRKEGVECIDIPWSPAFRIGGGGPDCL